MLNSANDIRSLFINYFKKNKHEVVASSSLIPDNDPTLLFVNAGMVQFKSVFLGTEKRPYQRAVSSQRCVRAGGKHNDLERVGYTARHHTFFEMLGNFSFGDYFKRDAIQYAWDFLTNQLKLPKEKLWVTVFQDDDEAADIWLKEIGVDPARFSRLGEDSNFWAMGATGPCGPCTEIFYDHGEEIYGGPPGTPDEDGDRYVEIWNLVFMQYNRDESGELTPLPKPSVDTGMGLERITAVMQGVHNNYDTDLFQPLIAFTAELTETKDLTHTSLRVIADHIRSAAFLITDGVTPSNEGRGYVLRRIIRRALRHGTKLGLHDPFFYKLISPLVEKMGAAYPELKKIAAEAQIILKREEEQFSLTLTQGLRVFDQAIRTLTEKVIPGALIFKLYDTYGFPPDLTADMAREHHLEMDEAGFEKCMSEQRERSREASQFDSQFITHHDNTPTEFTGYKHHLIEKITEHSQVMGLFAEGKPVNQLSTGQQGVVILDRTPFYAESGGQVGDQGTLSHQNNIFHVTDTQKQGQAFVHYGYMEKGSLQLHATITAQVDMARRRATVLNHTATHLLHHTLRRVLGEHVLQKGSLVAPDRLRFDFSHGAPLSAHEIEMIERAVNADIRANHDAHVHTTTPEKAVAEGALALFGEKYGETVRVVRFGDSVELCGGTHAHHTGEIGLFKIISESGVAAGIRRIEAVTGEGALDWIKKSSEEAQQKLQQSEDKYRQLEKQFTQLKQKLSSNVGQDLATQARNVAGVQVLTAEVNDMDSKSLRDTVDQLKNKLGEAVIVLATVKDNRASVVAGVTKNLTAKIKAGDLVKHLAEILGGKGGGRPDLAEGGGTQVEKLKEALSSVDDWVTNSFSKK
ncbi:MAG: alanine--tRNA ligase [Gammaproteobacteria bacterium]|nr:alanine--tRNA ligase [Gammaproteobacteria bacterium]